MWKVNFTQDTDIVHKQVKMFTNLLLPALTNSWFAKSYAKVDYQLERLDEILKINEGEKEVSCTLALPPVLAQETLYKLLYLDNIEHIRYELGERLTSFDADSFVTELKKLVPDGFSLNYRLTRFCGSTFANQWHKAGVQVTYTSNNGEEITHKNPPNSFVKLFVEIKLDQ